MLIFLSFPWIEYLWFLNHHLIHPEQLFLSPLPLYQGPREYLKAIAKLKIVAIGFARPFPAISGADP